MACSREEVMYMALEVIIAVACCLGNVLVIWAVWTCGAFKKATFCFIVSLAVADFLVGAVAIPMAVFVDVGIQTSFHGCLFICCVVIVLTQASVHSLLAIAVDRFLRVYIPLKYKSRVKLVHLWATVAACWVSASVLGFIPMFGWNKYNSTLNSSTIECKFMTVICMEYMVYFNFITCLLPPTVIMTVLYCYVFCIISQQLRGGVGRAIRSSAYYLKEKKLANSLALVLALFAACWLPLHIMNTISIYHSNVVSMTAVHVGILLSHANSAVNPVVYAFKIPKIKQAYKKAWNKLLRYEAAQQNDQHSHTGDNNLSSITNSNVILTNLSAVTAPQATT